MTKAVLLRIHRWIFLTFSVPLAVIIVTGLILSFQPILQVTGIQPGTITLQQIEGYFAQHDPEGRARGISIDHFEKAVTLQGVGPEGAIYIDLKTGGEAGDDSWLSEWMYWSRPVHEHFVFDLEEITKIPIVLLSSIGMVFAMVVGIFMGLPQVRNTISGWHKLTAWTLLPLLILSPLTGVFMALRISFGEQAARTQAIPVLDAVRLVAARHDLSGLQSVRPRGGRQIAVVSDGSARFSYVVSRDGLKPAPSNWPRTFHQGDFFGIGGGVMNAVLSLAYILLLITGVWIWGRRRFRAFRRRARHSAVASAPAE